MPCVSRGSSNPAECASETNIHLPGLKNLDNPGFLVFPQVEVCLDCGLTQFTLQATKPRLLGEALRRSA